MSSFTRGVTNVDDLLSSVTDHYKDGLTEQFYKGNRITKQMMKAGSIEEIDGGNDIVRQLGYQKGGTVSKITRTSSVAVNPNQQFTAARWGWSGLGGSVVLNDWDDAQNAGKSKLFDLMAEKLNNVREEMDQKFEEFALASSTADTTSLWSLLDVIDAADPSVANYGDIDRDSYTWWQATEVASGAFSSQGLEDLRLAYETTSRAGMDPVSMLITTLTVYNAYKARLTSFERLTSSDKGDLEFDTLTFNGKPFFYAEQMASGTLLGVNTKHTKLIVNKNMKFKNQPFVRTQGGQTRAAIIQLMCQIVCTRPASNFKLTSIS